MQNRVLKEPLSLMFDGRIYGGMLELSDRGLLHLTLTTPIGMEHSDKSLGRVARQFIAHLNIVGSEAGFAVDSTAGDPAILGLAPPRNLKFQFVVHSWPDKLDDIHGVIAKASESFLGSMSA